MKIGDTVAYTPAEGGAAEGTAWDRGPLVRGGWLDPWWLLLPDGTFALVAKRRGAAGWVERVRLAAGQAYTFDPRRGWTVAAAPAVAGACS